MINTFLSVFHSPNPGALQCANRSTCPSRHSLKLTVNLPISFVTSLFWSRIITITRGVYYMSFLCVESAAVGPKCSPLLSSTCCVFLTLKCVLWYLPSLPPLDSLTVPSPSSACVRSSTSEYQRHHATPPLQNWNAFLTTPPFTPFTPHPPPL